MYRSGPTIVTPRPRHRLRRLLIVVIVLVVLLAVADRVALVVSEKAAARTIQNSQNLNSTPSVTVGGFPFLTQLVSDHLDEITIKAHDVPAGSGSRALTIAALTVVLHGVHVSHDLKTVRADSATATGTVSYADLSQVLGVSVSYAGTSGGVGRVRASGSVKVLGQTITATVTSGLALSGDSLEFASPQVDGTSLPSAAIPLLQGVFGGPLALTGLPFGVKVSGVSAAAAGLTIQLSGAQLVYQRS